MSRLRLIDERMGMGPDEICSSYPTLKLADVHTALAYYYCHKAEIDNQIREDVEWIEQFRAGAPSVREKLKTERWGEGLIRFAGALADEWTEEDDRVLEEIHRSRHKDNRHNIT